MNRIFSHEKRKAKLGGVLLGSTKSLQSTARREPRALASEERLSGSVELENRQQWRPGARCGRSRWSCMRGPGHSFSSRDSTGSLRALSWKITTPAPAEGLAELQQVPAILIFSES